MLVISELLLKYSDSFKIERIQFYYRVWLHDYPALLDGGDGDDERRIMRIRIRR